MTPGPPLAGLGMHIFSSRRNPASRTRCPRPPAFDGFAGQPLASTSRAAQLTRRRRRTPGRITPAAAWRAARPVSHRLFPLFYLVEIRHCQLLKVANAHPPTDTPVRLHCEYGIGVVVDAASRACLGFHHGPLWATCSYSLRRACRSAKPRAGHCAAPAGKEGGIGAAAPGG